VDGFAGLVQQVVGDAIWEKLRDIAKEASTHAYAPYSKFKVGCAILHDPEEGSGGNVRSGTNVENASYGLCICAERATLFGCHSQNIQAICIYTPTPKPSAPCGACRQVMREFCKPETPVRSYCDSDEVLITTLAELLPNSFGPESLT